MWVYDIARGVKPLLSTAPEGDDFHPVWSPSGEEVAFSSNRAGNFDIFLTPADGGGEELLLATADNEVANDWSRDGNHLLVNITVPETADDLWYLERNGAGNGWEPHPFLQTPSNEYYAKFSPDGRYVACPEVTASSNGGTKPRWRRDGKELLYLEGNKGDGGFGINGSELFRWLRTPQTAIPESGSNGRQLHRTDVVYLQQCTPVIPGRYWLDARGNGGVEGGPIQWNLALLCSALPPGNGPAEASEAGSAAFLATAQQPGLSFGLPAVEWQA